MLFLETEQFNSEIFSIVEIFSQLSAQEVIEFTKKGPPAKWSATVAMHKILESSFNLKNREQTHLTAQKKDQNCLFLFFIHFS